MKAKAKTCKKSQSAQKYADKYVKLSIFFGFQIFKNLIVK